MVKKELDRLPNIHPGEVLLEEFLKPFGVSAYKLAQDTRSIHPDSINHFENGPRALAFKNRVH